MIQKAFTLIELLVVIVVIGILASISTATYKNYIERANIVKDLVALRNNVTAVQAMRIEYENGRISSDSLLAVEMDVVHDALVIARKKEQKVLRNITGNTCSDCGCRNLDFIDDAGTTPIQNCINTWGVITSIIDDAADINLSFLHTDPWGSPYLIDENEQEFSGNPCRQDNIFSAGPDQYHEVSGETVLGDGFSKKLDFYDVTTCP